MAVATLLRLTDADLRDAAVLVSGRDPRNAPALAARAIARMVSAVATTEIGWPHSVTDDLELIPDQNPLKRSLAATSELLPAMAAPTPLDDGRAPPMPDHGTLREGMLQARALLKDLALRFEVDLVGDAPAGCIVPVRPEPPPKVLRPATPRRLVPPVPVTVRVAPLPRPAKVPPQRTSPAPETRRPERRYGPPPDVGSSKSKGGRRSRSGRAQEASPRRRSGP